MATIVRARFPDMPVLLASGYSEEVVKGAGGEFEILPKPYGAESLASALAKITAPLEFEPGRQG